ncbi:MAG: heme NO-binding domain-containing protein [Actinomycetes bacterium]
MYGMVHKGLQEMIQEHHGDATWQAVLDKAQLSTHTIFSNHSYSDEETFALVSAAKDVLSVDATTLLQGFGRYWVTVTAQRYYATLMDASGNSVPTFLRNLNSVHARLGLIFPGYRPPRFECSNETESSIDVVYRSERVGLTPFVEGLMAGLGDRFETPLSIELLTSKAAGDDADSFRLSW